MENSREIGDIENKNLTNYQDCDKNLMFKKNLLHQFSHFMFAEEENKTPRSRKSLIKSLLDEESAISHYHSQENESGHDLEYRSTTKQRSEKSDTIEAALAPDESDQSMSDGTYHRSFISDDDVCGDCQSQFVKLKIPVPDE